MFDLIKFGLLACGCAAVYGLATGADLNTLFNDLSGQVVPVAQDVVAGLWDFVRKTLGSNG